MGKKNKNKMPVFGRAIPQELKCGCVVFITETSDDAILTFDRRCRAVKFAESEISNPARLVHLAHMHVAKMQGKV